MLNGASGRPVLGASSVPFTDGLSNAMEKAAYTFQCKEMLKTFEVFLWKKISFRLKKWIGSVFLSLFISLIFNVQAPGDLVWVVDADPLCCSCCRHFEGTVNMLGRRAVRSHSSEEVSSHGSQTLVHVEVVGACVTHTDARATPRPTEQKFLGTGNLHSNTLPPRYTWYLAGGPPAALWKILPPLPNPPPFLYPLHKILDRVTQYCWNWLQVASSCSERLWHCGSHSN